MIPILSEDRLSRTSAFLSEVRSAIRDLSDALDGMLTKDRMARIRVHPPG